MLGTNIPHPLHTRCTPPRGALGCALFHPRAGRPILPWRGTLRVRAPAFDGFVAYCPLPAPAPRPQVEKSTGNVPATCDYLKDPSDGKVTMLGDHGDTVPVSVTVHFECDAGYFLRTSDTASTCRIDRWAFPPRCAPPTTCWPPAPYRTHHFPTRSLVSAP